MTEHYVTRLFTDQETANEAFAYVVGAILIVVGLRPTGAALGGLIYIAAGAFALPVVRRTVGYDPGKWRVALIVLAAVLIGGLIGHFEAVA